jgi:gliding motility-associated-like protein
LNFDHNINDPIASPLVTTIYYVDVTDINHCSNSDSIKVFVRPQAIFTISPDAGACANVPTQLFAGGGDTYLWSPASQVSNAAINNPTTSITATATYTVQIKENTCGTSANLSTTLTLLPALSVSASKANDLDCYVGSSQLNAYGATKYVWSPTAGLNNANIENPVASPFSTQKYIVKGTDELGCIGSDSVTVYGNFTDRLVYNLANAFSPNNDGKNDCYGIEYFGPISDFTFIIYNRWGQQMFSTNNPSVCWNGTFQGQQMPEDAYVYYIKAVTACGTTEKKGTVVLVR